MGGTSSKTRKLVVENEDPTSVIQVSDDVANRLRGRQATPSKVKIEKPLSTNLPIFCVNCKHIY